MTDPIIIIPARMASVRLPGKPLAKINGTPMIVHVMRRAVAANIGPVWVAAAEQEIVNAVIAAGGNAVLTDPAHPSGTDRIYEAVQKIDPNKRHDLVINLQGDLPTINPAIIKDILTPFANSVIQDHESKEVEITTLAAKITDQSEVADPNVVKPVISFYNNGKSGGVKSGRVLYFTRTAAPYGKGDLYHHIGIYAYRRQALEKFTTLPPSLLEKREKLEQLRALENNMRIDVMLVDTVPLGVDTEADLKKAEKILCDIFK